MADPTCYVVQASDWHDLIRIIAWLLLAACLAAYFATHRFLDQLEFLVRWFRRWMARRRG